MNANGKDNTPPIIKEMNTKGIEIIVKNIIGTKELVFLVAKANAAPHMIESLLGSVASPAPMDSGHAVQGQREG